jgi:predicted AAA+ superfamily ATPase
MVIDEIQRRPQLLLAIKELVDSEPDPGRFLLTGSARVLGLRALPDALPGRMETIELWPLSQGEIDGRPDQFVDAVFRDGPNVRHESLEDRAGYIGRLVRGGFPEAVARTGRRRERFAESYVADLVNRDVLQLSAIERGSQMRALIGVLAGRNGQILSAANVSRDIGLSRQTVERHIGLLEEVFLIKRIAAWSRNIGSRATGAPKLAFVDSGLAAVLAGQDETSLGRLDSPLGGALESFAAMEIARQLTWSAQTIDMFHYRTRDKVEVDIVLENRRRQVVAIEVKASATAHDGDFRGIRHLQARLGSDLLAGIVLYLGGQTLPFGDRLRAMPLSALWEL